MDNTKRIQLLTEAEISDLYDRPDFTADERELFFAISQSEQETLAQYHNVRTRVYFILQLGYFKAKQQFFQFTFEEVADDTRFILKKFFDQAQSDNQWNGGLSRDSLRSQKQAILELFEYQDWSTTIEPTVFAKLCELIRYFPKGHSALRQLLFYLDRQRIITPTYRKLQDMFSEAFAVEEARIKPILQSISDYWCEQLSALIEHKDGLNQLTLLKADQKDFQYTAVKFEIEKAQSLEALYRFSEEFLPTLKISKNAIRYYADIVEQYAAYRLRRLGKYQQWLYALCFIFHRYQQITDNLIVTFLYHVRAIMDSAKAFAETEQLKHSSQVTVDFPKLAKFLKWFPTRSQNLTPEELNDMAYSILPKEQFTALADFLTGNTFDKTAAKWQYYASVSRLISLYLRPIMLAVPFSYYREDSHVMELIALIKTHYANGKSPNNLKIADDLGLTIPKHLQAYLKRKPEDEYLDPYRFEFFIYQKMYHLINRGKLCCNASVSYCDINHDLINDLLVDDIEKVAQEFGYPKLPVYCESRLDEAMDALNQAWRSTTENIRLEQNEGFQIKETTDGKFQWRLLYDRSEKLDDSFFRTLPKTEIADVMMFIGELTGMWHGFTHLKSRYTKRKKPVPLALNACILSEAFGFGTIQMSEMSDIDYSVLRSTREDFVRIETLCAANDWVSNFINGLSIFKIWNLLDDKLLADADGQKFETTDSTIQSRYSKKHFGKGRGISLYTLIANHVAVTASNLGLNEYEGHCLYDMVYGNKTDIDIHSVTGDNHSLNKINFVALDAIDVNYVPSIKNVREASESLFASHFVDNLEGPLRPVGTIDAELIRSQSRGLKRVLLSLVMQENTQSHLIRKLNSHTRYARLRAALYEYNKIFKSTHVLNLIDDMHLRKAIRTARNRTESYHQLQSLIRKIYNNAFKGKKISDNRVSAHAARLVANCIVAYNAMILNRVYEKMVTEEVPEEILEKFARISPIAWQHLFFTGRYSFKKANKTSIDVAALAELMEQHLKQAFWKS
ncbi:Tn3 family transposase [Vibrio parahaemolyticus]|uniref:Tn3 family transposase n=1 Tax=Vibrio parahaemolyticus TaxID=670 RepID=UPI00387B98E1